MPQSDGKNKLKRIEFIFNGRAYRFALNPEEYQHNTPNRANVTQTKAGAWIDEFGAGIPIIQFKGTTGFKNGSNIASSGFDKFKELKKFIDGVYDRVAIGQTVPSSKELLFYNYTDEEYWVVTPTQFDLLRSVSRPHMFAYNISLICQRKISKPNTGDISSSSNVTAARRLT